MIREMADRGGRSRVWLVLLACLLAGLLALGPGVSGRAFAETEDAEAAAAESAEEAEELDDEDEAAAQDEAATDDADSDAAEAAATEDASTSLELLSTATLDELAAYYADEIPDGIYVIQNNKSGRVVIDVASAGTASGTNVQLYTSNGTGAQLWKVTHDSQGYITFTNVNSGKVLDVKGGKTANKTNVQIYTSNGTDAQKWVAVPDDQGGYTLYSALGSSTVLDVSGGKTANKTNIQLYKSNGTAAQSFLLVSTDIEVEASTATDISSATPYRLAAACASGKVVDIKSGSTDEGANAQLYTSNSTLAQLYTFVYADGYYTIVSAVSGLALGVKNGDVISGANVAQYEVDSTDDAQLWSASQNSDGTYTFINKATGLALTVAGGGTSSGTNIDAETPSGSSSQKFSLTTQSDLLVERTYTIMAAESIAYVVDVKSASLSDGANVQLYKSNSTNAQKFYIAKVDGETNTYTIECTASGKLLTDVDGDVLQYANDGDEDQWWVPSITADGITFTNVSTGRVLDLASATYANSTNVQASASGSTSAPYFRLSGATAAFSAGTYTICLASSTTKVLDVKGASFSKGVNVQLYTSNGTGAQVWKITKNSDGTYTIKNRRSFLVLDVKSGKTADGTNVQQWTSNSTNAQKWNITYVGGGWQITSALDSTKALTIADGSTSNGANVEISTYTGSSSQVFLFSSASYSISGDETLDGYLANIYRSEGTNLKTLFYHVVDDYTYIRTSDDVSASWTTWSVKFAKQMVQNGGGNCYRHAALFCWLAIGLGYDASVVTGYVPSRSSGWAPHGWVEIVINGTTYVYDPDLAKDYPSYNWYQMTYSSAPTTYKKSS